MEDFFGNGSKLAIGLARLSLIPCRDFVTLKPAVGGGFSPLPSGGNKSSVSLTNEPRLKKILAGAKNELETRPFASFYCDIHHMDGSDILDYDE